MSPGSTTLTYCKTCNATTLHRLIRKGQIELHWECAVPHAQKTPVSQPVHLESNPRPVAALRAGLELPR
jgi:hypothetical protein